MFKHSPHKFFDICTRQRLAVLRMAETLLNSVINMNTKGMCHPKVTNIQLHTRARALTCNEHTKVLHPLDMDTLKIP